MPVWWQRLRGSNQQSLLLFVAMPLVLVSALGIRFGFDQTKQIQENVLKDDLELIARAIRIPVGEALTTGDDSSLALVFQSIFMINRVYGISVFDPNGKRIASGGIAEADLTSSTIPGQIKITGEMQEDYREVEGREVFSHFLPLFNSSGQSEGFIQITRRKDDFSHALTRLVWIAWAVWGLFAITIIGVVLLGYRSGLGRHVNQLIDVMTRVRKGQRNARASLAGPHEIAEIAAGLNTMLQSIEDYEGEIEARRTAEKTLLSQLKDQEKMAAIGDMARGFAHELAAPLTVIDGRAKRLLRSKQIAESDKYELIEIRSQVDYLTATIRQLLEYSRRGNTVSKSFSLPDVVHQVEAVHAGFQTERNIHTDVNLPDNMPALTGDPDRLRIALSCLFRNAMQAATSRVSLRGEIHTEHLLLLLEDDGPGLDKKSQTQLKQPFFTTKASGEGTGLGLAIAENIIVDHGGSLELNNHEGGGCRVSVRLPIQPSQE